MKLASPSLWRELKASSKIVSDMEMAKLQTQIPTLAKAATSVNGMDLLALEVDTSDPDQLRSPWPWGLKAHLGAASIVILGSKASGSGVVIVVAGAAAVAKGYKAGELVSVASKVLGAAVVESQSLPRAAARTLTSFPRQSRRQLQ